MAFKDLKIGGTFYIVNKDSLELKQVKIANITAPHIENKINSLTQMVVDITVDVNGKPITYVVPDNLSITYCGQDMLTYDKTLLIDEIKAIKAINEQTVSMYQKASENVLKCDNLISELDDVYREKKANDERLAKLERMMETLLTNFTTPQPTVPVTALPSIQN
jgi:hypothetical protein